jgi:hypothetical protein
MALVQQIPCAQPAGLQGLGCPGCDGKCNNGLGVFDSGFDLSQWGIAEWGIVAGGAYVLFSVFSTTKRGAARVRKSIRKRKP